MIHGVWHVLLTAVVVSKNSHLFGKEKVEKKKFCHVSIRVE